MYIDKLLNKSVRSNITQNSRAKKIRLLGRSCGRLNRILLDVCWCYEKSKNHRNLSSSERIMVESKWTDSILELLAIGNTTVMQSIRYRLREQTPEEDDEEREG
jgi:hypothetical protein